VEQYRLTTTFEDDLTNIRSSLSLEEALQFMLEDAAEEEIVWFKLEKMEEEEDAGDQRCLADGGHDGSPFVDGWMVMASLPATWPVSRCRTASAVSGRA